MHEEKKKRKKEEEGNNTVSLSEYARTTAHYHDINKCEYFSFISQRVDFHSICVFFALKFPHIFLILASYCCLCCDTLYNNIPYLENINGKFLGI